MSTQSSEKEEFFCFSQAEDQPKLIIAGVRPALGELEHNLVQVAGPASILPVLDLSTQEPGKYSADIIPGMALSINVGDTSWVEGRIYTIGKDGKVFIPSRVIDANSTDKPNERIACNVERSMLAYREGDWFEHVYPFNKTDVTSALKDELRPLIKYAQQENAFFVVVVVDGSYIVMPAAHDKAQASESGASQRYADYINVRDDDGNIAAQAVIYIDPGEQSGYTDSEAIGVPDGCLPVGQKQYDVAYGEGYVVDEIVHRLQAGSSSVVAVALGSGSIGGEGAYCDWRVHGAEEQVIKMSVDPLGKHWKVPSS